MSRDMKEKYTEAEINQIIFTDYTKPTTRFLLVGKGVNDYIFTKIFKRSEIKINEDFITIRKKYSLLTRHFEDILLIEQLNMISGF